MMKGWTDDDGTLHEECKGLVFIGSNFLGEFFFDPGAHPELRYRRTGVAYFCSFCGDTWARLVILNSEGSSMPLEPRRCSCEKHEEPWGIAGSLLITELEGLLDILPEPAVKRELMLLLR
jgi:hypothetical protein